MWLFFWIYKLKEASAFAHRIICGSARSCYHRKEEESAEQSWEKLEKIVLELEWGWKIFNYGNYFFPLSQCPICICLLNTDRETGCVVRNQGLPATDATGGLRSLSILWVATGLFIISYTALCILWGHLKKLGNTKYPNADYAKFRIFGR